MIAGFSQDTARDSWPGALSLKVGRRFVSPSKNRREEF
jgi:hypothetical protein